LLRYRLKLCIEKVGSIKEEVGNEAKI